MKTSQIEKWIQNQINYFECQCECANHTLRFIYDSKYNELYTEIQLYQYKNIFQRILLAIKYVFGYSCKYGHWDTWMLKPEDCTKLIKLLNKVKKGNYQNKKFN